MQYIVHPQLAAAIRKKIAEGAPGAELFNGVQLVEDRFVPADALVPMPKHRALLEGFLAEAPQPSNDGSAAPVSEKSSSDPLPPV